MLVPVPSNEDACTDGKERGAIEFEGRYSGRTGIRMQAEDEALL